MKWLKKNWGYLWRWVIIIAAAYLIVWGIFMVSIRPAPEPAVVEWSAEWYQISDSLNVKFTSGWHSPNGFFVTDTFWTWQKSGDSIKTFESYFQGYRLYPIVVHSRMTWLEEQSSEERP